MLPPPSFSSQRSWENENAAAGGPFSLSSISSPPSVSISIPVRKTSTKPIYVADRRFAPIVYHTSLIVHSYRNSRTFESLSPPHSFRSCGSVSAAAGKIALKVMVKKSLAIFLLSFADKESRRFLYVFLLHYRNYNCYLIFLENRAREPCRSQSEYFERNDFPKMEAIEQER